MLGYIWAIKYIHEKRSPSILVRTIPHGWIFCRMCKSFVNRYDIDIPRGVPVLLTQENAPSFHHLFTFNEIPQWSVLILSILTLTIEILQFFTANKTDCKDICESAGGKIIPLPFIKKLYFPLMWFYQLLPWIIICQSTILFLLLLLLFLLIGH